MCVLGYVSYVYDWMVWIILKFNWYTYWHENGVELLQNKDDDGIINPGKTVCYNFFFYLWNIGEIYCQVYKEF